MAEVRDLKTFDVQISPRALLELQQIKIDIYEASKSDAVTCDYLKRIASQIDSLNALPMRFPFWKNSRTYRFLITEKYLIFYRVRAEVVEVSHIRYAGRRPSRG